jgi:hypothetical protein
MSTAWHNQELSIGDCRRDPLCQAYWNQWVKLPRHHQGWLCDPWKPWHQCILKHSPQQTMQQLRIMACHIPKPPYNWPQHTTAMFVWHELTKEANATRKRKRSTQRKPTMITLEI